MSVKKVAKIRKETGLPIVKIMVRGGTEHRKDLCLEDGTIKCLWPDGTITDGEFGWRK